MRNNHIFLIGMPGSGKSSLGLKLAKSRQCLFLDTDRMINVKTGLSVIDYWKTFGELNFRSLEREILFEFSNSIPSLIATGGGLPCYFDNMHYLKQYGTVIFINTSLEELIERNKNASNPMIKDASATALHSLLNTRLPYYERADFKGSTEECEKYLRTIL